MDGDLLPSRLRLHRHDDALGAWTIAACQPHPALAGQVAQLWYGEGRVSYRRDRILPSGASYLLINLGPRQYLVAPGPPERRIAFDDVWYSGLQQGPIDTEAPHGSALLGVAFLPGGAWPWLGIDAAMLANRTLPLADVLGDGVLALRERLLNTAGIAARIALVERWLRTRIATTAGIHAAVEYALQRLAATDGRLSMEALAQASGIGRKRLGALFRRQIGLTPKLLARVYRFQSALQWLAAHEQVPWTALAAHCGYYDQPHLIRDFRAFSGLTPGEFVTRARPDATSVVLQ